MFPFRRDDSVLVQPLYRNGNSLAFACEELLEAVSTGLKVRDPEGRQAQVLIQNHRRADDHSWIYFAQLLEGEIEPQWPAPGYQWRRSPRYVVGLRVRSPQLPEYTALTEDLSLEGLQLATAGPLRVGEEIELHLDLDGGFPALHTMARVCWSRLTQPWKAGLAFSDMDSSSLATLRAYLGQRAHESRLPGFADQQEPGGGHPPSVLEKMALLQSSYDDGDYLVLKLLTNNEAVEMRFLRPLVLQSNLQTQLVRRIITQPTAQGLTRTWLLDPQDSTLVELESTAPEIVCRGLRLHDLG